MIWVRRIIALPFIILAFVTFQIGVLAQQTASNLISPSFYLETLADSNVYSFLLTDLPTTALKDVRKANSNPIIEQSGLSDETIVSSINTIVPPDWLQSNFESTVTGVGDYVTGRTDEFTISIPVDERVQAASNQITFVLNESDIYKMVMENQVRPVISEASKNELPFDVSVNEDQLMASIQKIISKAWLTGQIDSVLSEVVPYAVGSEDTFSVVVKVDDRIEVAVAEVKSIMADANAYEALFEGSIAPNISSSIGNSAKLPYGIEITDEEISSIIRKTAPPSWMQKTTESILDNATPYLVGRTDEFTISINIEPNKEEAVSDLMALAEQKLNTKLADLPDCDADEVVNILNNPVAGLPSCYPADPSLKQQMQNFTRSYVTTVISAVRPQIINTIPNSIDFDQNSLRQVVPAKALESFDQGRDIVREGYTFTEKDLESLIKQGAGDNSWNQVSKVRDSLSKGIQYNEQDFRIHIETVTADGGQTLSMLDQLRGILKLVHMFNMAVYIPTLLIAAIVGFLGGRGWIQRLMWAAITMLVASILVYAIWGPVYSSVAEPIIHVQIDQIASQASGQIAPQFLATESLVVQQVTNIGKIAISKFISGISGTALITSILSLAIVVGCVVLNKINSK
ncbi:MAG: hypothetical protein ACJ0BG_01225 [Dehalococcoidia bacterium]|tara:strand:- start:2173 stop:4062 length:1890 start_codon:yes stop_codon:yes gene_type:complete